jgi:hypothetical protein
MDFAAQRVAIDGRSRVLINPTTLFEGCAIGRNAKFLLPLINNKWPPKVDSGGHSFSFLNISINNESFFLSEVVIFEKMRTEITRHNQELG